MPRTCTICRHPKQAEINQALVAGDAFRIIAKHFETSWQAVRRHRDHLPDQVAKAHDAKEVARADDLLASITALRQRLQTALDDAETARDVASVARELRETFRLMLELEGRLRRGAQVNVGVASGEPRRVEIVVRHVRVGVNGQEEILSETERDVPSDPAPVMNPGLIGG
jgi:hypothetical protein